MSKKNIEAKQRGKASQNSEIVEENIEEILHAQQISWKAPLPSPETVEQYENILPGTFDRILKMQELRNRSTAEAISKTAETSDYFVKGQLETAKTGLIYTSKDKRRGDWLGAAICFIAMILGTLMTLKGHGYVGGAIIGIPVMSVSVALVKGSLSNNASKAEH